MPPNVYGFMAQSKLASTSWLMIAVLYWYFTGLIARSSGLTFIEEPEDVIANKGSPLVLNCSVNTSPDEQVAIRWRKNGIPLEINSHRIAIAPNGSLLFSKIVKKRNGLNDEGMYECIASSQDGSISSGPANVQLGRLGPFIVQPENISVARGNWATLPCQIAGKPTPEIVWHKNLQPINVPNNRYVQLSSGTLQIRAVVSEDSGCYHCMAFNPVTYEEEHSVQACLNVTTRLSEEQMSPLELTQKTHAIIVGEDQMLECFTTGVTSPAITWIKRNAPDFSLSGHLSIVGQGSLLITGVDKSDAGQYECHIEGSRQTEFFQLFVLEAPYLIESTSKLSNGNIKVLAGNRLRLTCRFGGTPMPLVGWLLNAQPVQDVLGSRYAEGVVNQQGFLFRELVIENTLEEDSGFYQCTATNSVGFASHSELVEVHPVEHLPPPSDLIVNEVTSTNVTVAFRTVNPGYQAKIIAHSVHYKKTSGGKEFEEVYGYSGNPHSWVLLRLPPLTPYTNYTIYVKAYSQSSIGMPCQPIYVQTKEGVPTSVPAMTLEATSPTSLLVDWELLPPDQACGVLAGHLIFYTPLHTTEAPRNISVPPAFTSYMLSGLERELAYKVLVISGSRVGYPNQRTLSNSWRTIELPPVQSGSVPDPPVLKLSNVDGSTVEVLWHMPWEANGRTIQTDTINVGMCTKQMETPPPSLLDFTIMVAILGNDGHSFNSENSSRFLIPHPESRRYIVEDLLQNMWYKVSLVASNRAGRSKRVWTAIRTADITAFQMAKNKVPPAPTSLMSYVRNESSILIQWVAPHWLLLTNLTYRIRLRSLPTEDESFDTHLMFVSVQTEGSVITDLKPYTKYEISVQSVSDSVRGPFTSAVVHCQTYEGVPSAPRDVYVNLFNSVTVQLSWRPPAQRNGQIIGYTISYSTDRHTAHQNWTHQLESPYVTQVFVRNLRVDAVYFFLVRAQTKVGWGPPGQLLQIRMQPDNYEMGVIIGVCLGGSFIIICIIVFCCRNRCVIQQQQVARQHCRCQCQHANGNIPTYNGNHSMIPYDESCLPMIAINPVSNGRVCNGSIPPSARVQAVYMPNGHIVTQLVSSHEPLAEANKEELNEQDTGVDLGGDQGSVHSYASEGSSETCDNSPVWQRANHVRGPHLVSPHVISQQAANRNGSLARGSMVQIAEC